MAEITINGDATADGPILLYPGTTANSLMLVKGNVSVTSSENLIIGTNTNPDPVPVIYADLAVQKNMNINTGDVTLNENGRLAVFGDLNLSGGGAITAINAGAQVYIDGDGTGHSINVTSGGNHVQQQ